MSVSPVETGTDTRLLERDHEFARVDDLLESASRGRGGVLPVDGVAGIGKSSLLVAAGEGARSAGFAVLAARGHDAEREFPFGACLQLFERVVAESGRAEHLLQGAAELSRPLLGAWEAGTQADGPAAAPDRIFGLLHGLYWLTANLAHEEPVLLAVDDAQWLDEPSLRFLRYLAVRIEELPVAVVVAWRSGEPSPALGQLSELAAGVPRLQLGPLSAPSVAALVRARLAEAEPEFCQACANSRVGTPSISAS